MVLGAYNLQKWSGFRFLKTQMTKSYLPHVQMILKITSSAIQTRFSRLEQSQSWNFMKTALTKITAYWEVVHLCRPDFDPQPEISCFGPVWGGISKKKFNQQLPGNMPG